MNEVIHDIAVIPGDGIGSEVVPAAQRVLERAGERHGFGFRWHDATTGAASATVETGAMMPADGLDAAARHDAIFLGAVGAPGVPDHVSLWGLLIPIRRGVRAVRQPAPDPAVRGRHQPARRRRPAIDLVVVRENVEGEYSEVGGRLYAGSRTSWRRSRRCSPGAGSSASCATRSGSPSSRGGRLVSATKSNGIIHTMPFWDEVVEERRRRPPGVEVRARAHRRAVRAGRRSRRSRST